MNEEPKPLRYLKRALRYLKGASTKGAFAEGGKGGAERRPPYGTLRGLRRLRRYLKGASKPSKVP